MNVRFGAASEAIEEVGDKLRLQIADYRNIHLVVHNVSHTARKIDRATASVSSIAITK